MPKTYSAPRVADVISAGANPGAALMNYLLPIRQVAGAIDPGREKGSETMAHHAACAIRHLGDGIENLAAAPGREAGREDLRKAVRKIATARRFYGRVERPMLSVSRAAFVSRMVGRAELHLPAGEMAQQPWRENAARFALEALRHLPAVLTLADGDLPSASPLMVQVDTLIRCASAAALHRLAPGEQITVEMFYDTTPQS